MTGRSGTAPEKAVGVRSGMTQGEGAAAWVLVTTEQAERLMWLVRHWQRSAVGEAGVWYAVWEGMALRMTLDETGTLVWMETRPAGVMN